MLLLTVVVFFPNPLTKGEIFEKVTVTVFIRLTSLGAY